METGGMSQAMVVLLYGSMFWVLYNRTGNVLDVLVSLSRDPFLRWLNITTGWFLLSLVVRFLSRRVLSLELEMINLDMILFDEVTTSVPLYATFIVLDLGTFLDSWWLLNLCWFYDSLLHKLITAIPSNSTYRTLPTAADHTKFFLLNTIITGLHVHLFCAGLATYLSRRVVHDLLLCCIAFHQLSRGLAELLCHLWFVQDRLNFGSSIQTERRTRFTQGIFEILGVLPFTAYATWRVAAAPGFVAYARFALTLILVLAGVKMTKQTFDVESQIQNQFANATQKDIDRSGICVICRLPMTVEGTKVLKCGHCYHADCLERWRNVQHACPTCTQTTE
jgi:hypothetical protein